MCHEIEKFLVIWFVAANVTIEKTEKFSNTIFNCNFCRLERKEILNLFEKTSLVIDVFFLIEFASELE